MTRGFVLLSLVAVALAGCGKQPVSDRCSVQGVVKYKGQPVPFGFISFISTADPMNQITGQIKPDGTYVLTPAPVGDCIVVIRVNNAFDLQALQQQGLPIPKGEVLPRELGLKYADEKTSPMRKTLTAGENNLELNIE